MRILADVNVKEAFLTALRSEGHTVERVVDVEKLGATATDSEIISYATATDTVVLTNDAKDFEQFEPHQGIIIVPQTDLTPGEVAAAISHIERTVPNRSTLVLYATSWV